MVIFPSLRVTTQDGYGYISLLVAIERAHAQTVAQCKVKVHNYGYGAMKLKGGSNERPCQFVKRLEVIIKFVITHKL